MNPTRFGVFLLLATIALGCRASGPKTSPVTGQVLTAEGTPLSGGLIEFSAVSGSARAVGTIQKDGRFTLYTVGEKDRQTGAQQGTYRVTVTQRLGHDQTQKATPLAVSLPNTITVHAGQPNELTLRLPRPR
jgi:hypothetical protein